MYDGTAGNTVLKDDMAQLTDAKRALDVGTFTGMSAMAFAEGLPSDGEVATMNSTLR